MGGLQKKGATFFVNIPFLHRFFHQGTDLKIQVFNIIGKCILQTMLKDQMNGIEVSSLSKGVSV